MRFFSSSSSSKDVIKNVNMKSKYLNKTWNEIFCHCRKQKCFVIVSMRHYISIIYEVHSFFYKSNKSALQCVWSSYFPFIPPNHQTILSDQNTWFDCLKSSLISSFIGNPLSLTNLSLHFRYAIYHKFFLHENSIYFIRVSVIDMFHITWNWFLSFLFSTNHFISKLL